MIIGMYTYELQEKMLLYNLQIHTVTQVVKQQRLPYACYSSCAVVHLKRTFLYSLNFAQLSSSMVLEYFLETEIIFHHPTKKTSLI